MTRKVQHSLLRKAKNNKKDEFYTQLSDIESELQHYKNHFKDKVVFCNCDDPMSSNFFNYFASNFKELGIKKLISACYRKQERNLFNTKEFKHGFFYEYTGAEGEKNKPNSTDITYFKGDGDFRSAESIELLKQSDIIVTNPPFSLFREYVAQLVKYDKDIKFHTSIIISACLLHDIGKKGSYKNYKTEFVNHPLIASDKLLTTFNEQKLFYDVDEDVVMMIVNSINFHMGIFGPKEIEKPITEFTLHEMIIYTSDFLASRPNQNKNSWMEQQLKRIASNIGMKFEYT